MRSLAFDGSVAKLIQDADGIFTRLTAPCPQCHTLGSDPDCTAVIHHLPKEAFADISHWRNKASRPLPRAVVGLPVDVRAALEHHALDGCEACKALVSAVIHSTTEEKA